MTDKEFNAVANSKIFAGCDLGRLRRVLDGEGCKIEHFSSSQAICEPHAHLKSIGIILSGSALVLSSDSERHVLLRRLMTSDIFGVSSVFSKDCRFVSNIVAKGNCSVAFIADSAMSELLENDHAVLYNYINFLSDRIRFLNNKIRFFTSGSAERRLALYLDSFKTDKIRLDESMSALADMLDIGRASLYRAFDSLSSDGFIIREKDLITLTDPQKMVDHYNDK